MQERKPAVFVSNDLGYKARLRNDGVYILLSPVYLLLLRISAMYFSKRTAVTGLCAFALAFLQVKGETHTVSLQNK